MKRRAALIFLAADGAIFAALFVVYIYVRHAAPQWPRPFHFPSGLMAGALTMFALSGSVTMAFARQRAGARDYVMAMRLVVVTIGGWLIFLFLEGFEWVRLVWTEDITLGSVFGQVYFTLTGLHMLHVMAGVVWLLVGAVKIRKFDVGMAALYVHFTNVIWIVLFIGLYLTSADLQEL